MADDTAETCTVLFNPRCSKCRQARDILGERGVAADYVHYLDDTPSRDEIVRICGLLGLDDPRGMMRTGEPPYKELGLASAGPDALFDAMAAHPILIERPIVIVGDRAVVARPPERLLELLGEA
jgi:arsenate reductase (glutaredoxin)